MSNQDVVLAIMQRNQFYRRQYLLAVAAFFLALLVISVMIWVLNYVIRNPTAPLYFATDNVGRLIDVTPVTKPNMTTEDVASWTAHAIEKTFSYNYVNYHEQMQSAQKYFTNYGWNNYLKSLTASDNMEGLKKRKMIWQGKVIGTPKVLMEGNLKNGTYAWKFEMPLLVTYWLPPYDVKNTYSNALTVTVLVQRMPILQSNDGLGIAQLVVEFAKAPAAPEETITNKPT
jgi:intracellular multiplication protein IcmL